jgi:hypothetical protein
VTVPLNLLILYRDVLQQQQQHYLHQPAMHQPLSHKSSSGSLLETSPLISDLLAQLSTFQSGVAELRSQLVSSEAIAASAKTVLEMKFKGSVSRKRARSVRMEPRV